MTRDARLLGLCAVALLVGSTVATAAVFDAKEAKKTCLDRYNEEQAGGTIPAGMSKSKYLSQCVNSMRRNAELEKELTEQTPAVGGSNELTAGPAAKTGTTPVQSKPRAVATPSFAGPHKN